jgi:hypothetical protein
MHILGSVYTFLAYHMHCSVTYPIFSIYIAILDITWYNIVDNFCPAFFELGVVYFLNTHISISRLILKQLLFYMMCSLTSKCMCVPTE